jgi:hypothetical protein
MNSEWHHFDLPKRVTEARRDCVCDRALELRITGMMWREVARLAKIGGNIEVRH